MYKPPTLSPQRRHDDKGHNAFSIRLISFTDLMALLLSFFILLYATREPVDLTNAQEQKPLIPAIIHPPDPLAEGTLTTHRRGLDVQYIKGILDQAILRDPLFEGARAQKKHNHITIILPPSDAARYTLILNKLRVFKQPISLFAAPDLIEEMMQERAFDSDLVRFFPRTQNSAAVIVLHSLGS